MPHQPMPLEAACNLSVAGSGHQPFWWPTLAEPGGTMGPLGHHVGVLAEPPPQCAHSSLALWPATCWCWPVTANMLSKPPLFGGFWAPAERPVVAGGVTVPERETVKEDALLPSPNQSTLLRGQRLRDREGRRGAVLTRADELREPPCEIEYVEDTWIDRPQKPWSINGRLQETDCDATWRTSWWLWSPMLSDIHGLHWLREPGCVAYRMFSSPTHPRPHHHK